MDGRMRDGWMEAEEVDRREKIRQQLFKQGGWGPGEPE